jgi:hypothetical protein
LAAEAGVGATGGVGHHVATHVFARNQESSLLPIGQGGLSPDCCRRPKADPLGVRTITWTTWR